MTTNKDTLDTINTLTTEIKRLKLINAERASLILDLKRQVDTLKLELAAIPKIPKKPLSPWAWAAIASGFIFFSIYIVLFVDKLSW